MAEPSSVQPAYVLLEGVPRIHFYEGGQECPEDIPLPSAMRAISQFLGESDFGCRHCPTCSPNARIPCAYSYFLGTSGIGFQMAWKPDWAPGSVETGTPTPQNREMIRRAFGAFGYGYELVANEPGRDNEAYFRQRIIESIRDKRRPVLASGVMSRPEQGTITPAGVGEEATNPLVGPTEYGLITGYDEGGDVLIGWDMLQVFPEFKEWLEFEPTGQYRKRNWYRPELVLVLIGDRGERRPWEEIYRDALKWALEMIRTPWAGDRHNGLAAYDAWIEALSQEGEFATDDEAALRRRYDAHNMATGQVAEGRWYTSGFLVQAAHDANLHFDMVEDLLHAAAYYAGQHELMWRIWDLTGGIGQPQAHLELKKPEVRRDIVAVIREAREKEARAAEHIERALAK